MAPVNEYHQSFKAVDIFFKKKGLQESMDFVENEIYWRLIDLQEIEKGCLPLLFHFIDEAGYEKTIHAPYCRCQRCPMFSDEKLQESRSESPFKGLTISPNIVYQSIHFWSRAPFRPAKHMIFCRCGMCKKTFQYHMIKASKRVLRAELKRSAFTGVELLNTENIPLLRDYKELVIDNAIQSILTNPKKYVSRPRWNQ